MSALVSAVLLCNAHGINPCDEILVDLSWNFLTFTMSRKNKQATSLGRSLIKDRFGSTKGRRGGDVSMVICKPYAQPMPAQYHNYLKIYILSWYVFQLHTTEIDDGYEWGRLNLQSVTEESSFQEFLSTAELANTEFQVCAFKSFLLSYMSIGKHCFLM